VKRLKDLETENGRLRRAISDLTLDKLILQEAANRRAGSLDISCSRGGDMCTLGTVTRTTYLTFIFSWHSWRRLLQVVQQIRTIPSRLPG
jgi:hypothetical protein